MLGQCLPQWTNVGWQYADPFDLCESDQSLCGFAHCRLAASTHVWRTEANKPLPDVHPVTGCCWVDHVDVCRGPSAVLGRPPLHARWYTTSLHSNQFQPSLFSLSKSAWSHWLIIFIYKQTKKQLSKGLSSLVLGLAMPNSKQTSCLSQLNTQKRASKPKLCDYCI